VPEPVKAERLARLQAAINAAQARFNASRVGMNAEVLFERTGRRDGQIVGRSPWLSPVHVDGDAGLIGSIQRVSITGVGTNSLFGTLAGDVPETRGAMAEIAA
jgi:tRNA-2-methylthio-N6-dimethylallyladenosine synthase